MYILFDDYTALAVKYYTHDWIYYTAPYNYGGIVYGSQNPDIISFPWSKISRENYLTNPKGLWAWNATDEILQLMNVDSSGGYHVKAPCRLIYTDTLPDSTVLNPNYYEVLETHTVKGKWKFNATETPPPSNQWCQYIKGAAVVDGVEKYFDYITLGTNNMALIKEPTESAILVTTDPTLYFYSRSNVFNSEHFSDILDFGTAEQEVSSIFYDWLCDNAYQITDTKVSVYNNDGSILVAESELLPSDITSLQISVIGSLATLDIQCGDFSVPLTWEETADNFLGLSINESSTRAEFTNGVKNVVDITGPLSLYNVYGTSPFNPETLSITLYNNSAANNRVNKEQYLTINKVLNGTLRNATDILNPVILICEPTFLSANYAYINAFNRYYFITDIVSVAYGLWELHLRCDVLYTYYPDIISLTAKLKRQENSYTMSDYNKFLNDSKTTAFNDTGYVIVPITNYVFNVEDSVTDNIALTIAGINIGE